MRILSVDLREALEGNPVDNLLIQSRDRLSSTKAGEG